MNKMPKLEIWSSWVLSPKEKPDWRKKRSRAKRWKISRMFWRSWEENWQAAIRVPTFFASGMKMWRVWSLLTYSLPKETRIDDINNKHLNSHQVNIKYLLRPYWSCLTYYSTSRNETSSPPYYMKHTKSSLTLFCLLASATKWLIRSRPSYPPTNASRASYILTCFCSFLCLPYFK